MSDTVLSVCEVTVVRQGRSLIEAVSVDVRPGEQWALLGPNGAGKSTLLALCGARLHPTKGTVAVLGHRLGRVDMRWLRTHIGHVDPRTRIEPYLSVREAVLTGLLAAADLPKRWSPTAAESCRADELIEALGLAARASSLWSVLSQGERGRALIARALITEPRLLLLDEPTTGLDLAAREILLGILADVRSLRPELSSVLVTHHLEELPASTTHAVVLAGGRTVAAGPVAEALTSETVSQAFGHPIRIERRNGRWSATGAEPARV
ncbi:ATP-binding cassette domain-containing protein [Skermania sp. ID1734]|uniref:ABC transporter ATP-binding protein n=1 Tax=Skermania sp. ID1734 TaxID=2597516 RepID=UPI0011812557|nr:ATP-binding cassette domain-containing protein [Skermania sp. ID1734]TSD95331.1 ATP-binding cassette domain-containing protein [Skermania sp. ID1734]